MHLKSYGRITLALDILKRLPTGYHKLETIKSKIDVYDEITLEKAPETAVDCDTLEDTIVLKTITAVQQKYNINQHVKVIIKKNIPVCGGLAGGSSNAACVLQALNTFWKLNLSRDELVIFARGLGRDIPYFLFDGLVFDTEIDSQIETIGPSPELYGVVVNDGTAILTKDAYSWLDYSKIGLVKASQKIKNDTTKLVHYLHNDFEQFVFKKYPNLQKIKDELTKLGLHALMSGSGSTIFGLSFDKKEVANAYRKIKGKYPLLIQTTIIN